MEGADNCPHIYSENFITRRNVIILHTAKQYYLFFKPYSLVGLYAPRFKERNWKILRSISNVKSGAMVVLNISASTLEEKHLAYMGKLLFWTF